MSKPGAVAAMSVVDGVAGRVKALEDKTSATLDNTANGYVKLDKNGIIDSTLLPSYVDDVIEGYYDSVANKFYNKPNTEATRTEITGEKGKIYISLDTNYSYRFSGTTYVEITSSDMVELTAADVDAAWAEVIGSGTAS